MNRRMIEMSILAVITILSIIAYLGKINGWHNGYTFSTGLSITLIILLAASVIFILVLTIKGKLIGRRIVFLYIGIAITLPLFMDISQEIVVSNDVKAVYADLEGLPAGSKILVSFDYDPASAPELQPMAEAFIGECFKRDFKLIMMGLWPMGPQQANMAVDTIMNRMGLTDQDIIYGEDWVNLGFQTGDVFVIQRMGGSFESMFHTDINGRPYQDIPLVKNIKNFSNIDYSFNLSAGFPGTVEWVQVGVDRYGLKLSCGNTAVQAPTVYPYLKAGQLSGLIGGMNDGAAFEKLTQLEGKATKFMLSQSFSHLIIIAFIFIGNVAYFRTGRKSALKK